MVTTRKSTRPMVGNPSVEYMAGYFAWGRGQTPDANPHNGYDAASAKRWRRGWEYAEANRTR